MSRHTIYRLSPTKVLSFPSMVKSQNLRYTSGISFTEEIDNTGKNPGLLDATNLTSLGISEKLPYLNYFIVPKRPRRVKGWILKPEQKVEDNKQKAHVRKIISNIEREQDHIQHCIISRQEYHCNQKAGCWTPDWVHIRDILMRHSITHGPRIERAMQINMPIEWAKKYICNVDESIYEICRIHDCNIELTNPHSPQVCSGFILSGSQAATKEVVAHLVPKVPFIQITPPSPSRESARHVQSEHRRPRMPAHMIPMPIKWTYHSLLEYVQDITAFDPRFHLLRFAPSPPISRQTNYCIIVLYIIRNIISNSITRSVFSRKAIHTAMKFFVRKNRLDLVRELFVKMEYIGLQSNTETYNILLQGSALNEDLYNFNFILNCMLKDGHKPNGETWAIFMKALPHHKLREDLYVKMKEKGLLSHPKTLQITVEHLIGNVLETSLHQGQDHHSFIAKMNEEYGSKWLSVEAANRVLTIFGKHCLTYRAFQFLEYMEECFQFPDKRSINILLHSCTLSPDPWLALLNLMSIPKFRAILEPGSETYRIMFKLAWETRSYNTAKLTWRYACLSASTSFTLRRRVLKSMRNALTVSTGENHKKWLGAAGAILMGPEEHMHPMQGDLESHKNSNRTDSADPLSMFASMEKLEEDLSHRFNLDLQVFRDWRPCKTFAQMIWVAIRRDKKWKANKVFEEKDLNWLVNDSESIRIYSKHVARRHIIWN